jgi:Ni/Co efflux regulator RcnB
MRKLLIALMLAGAAAAPAIAAAPPALNSTNTQSRTKANPPVKNRSQSTNPKQQRTRIQEHRTTVAAPAQTTRRDRVQNVERQHAPVISRTPRIGTQPPLRVERRVTPPPQWNPNWRNDRTYNWDYWRHHHRSQYHLRRYRDPYGWRYQLFSIGWRLWPNYLLSTYWINDPWMYRLPPAPPGTRWIRYYNDALLVDMWSGEVIDVIHNFFW